MAAYDWGPGNVQRVVSRTGYADFWELYRRNVLPAETKAYVPGIIAAMIMAKNPDKYGLTDMVPDSPVLSDNVTVDYAIDMKLVADVTGATVQEIVALNPALLRLTTPRDSPYYTLHLPPGTLATFNERLKDIPEDKRTSWRFHVVRPGETMESIATAFHARATEIAEVNEVSAAKPLAVDDDLVVPVASVASSAGQTKYTLRRTDTLVTVADRFGITVQQLRSWNHLTAAHVAPGRSLYVAEPVRLAPGTHTTRGRKAKTGSKQSSASHSSGGKKQPAASNKSTAKSSGKKPAKKG
jgi:membrane-bound lytic murein transglycosylase D